LATGLGGCGLGSGLDCGWGVSTWGSIRLTISGRGGVIGSGVAGASNSRPSSPACANVTPISEAGEIRVRANIGDARRGDSSPRLGFKAKAAVSEAVIPDMSLKFKQCWLG
jgi:hypothetical protein